MIVIQYESFLVELPTSSKTQLLPVELFCFLLIIMNLLFKSPLGGVLATGNLYHSTLKELFEYYVIQVSNY